MARSRRDDWTVYAHGSYGRRVDSEFPDGVLAFLDTNEYATPEKLERARQIAPRATFSDYEVHQTGPDRWLFTELATGEEYWRVHHDPTIQANPKANGDITAFVVDDAGRLHFLRPKGPQTPTETVVLVSSVYGRQLS